MNNSIIANKPSMIVNKPSIIRNLTSQVILGGGSANFLPVNVTADNRGAMGNRKDGKNLIKVTSSLMNLLYIE